MKEIGNSYSLLRRRHEAASARESGDRIHPTPFVWRKYEEGY